MIKIHGGYNNWIKIVRNTYYDTNSQPGIELVIEPGDRLLDLQMSHNTMRDQLANLHTWYQACQEEAKLRNESPALHDAWEKYQIIKVLVKKEEEQ